MTLIYGTSNAGKLEFMRNIVAPLDIELLGLRDLNISLPDVDESGKDPLENARAKAHAYYNAIRTQTDFCYPVFSSDSGLYIEGVTNEKQPGVHVRRVNGKSLTDEEMIEYYAGLANGLGGQAFARYKNAICLVVSENETYEYIGDDIASDRFILSAKPHQKREHGFPLNSLSVRISDGKYYNDLTEKPRTNSESGFKSFFCRVLNLESSEKLHNKLVRDNIPAIIHNQGDTPVARVLNESEYLAALDKKLNEEILEYLEDGSVGEICDILEVIDAICVARGITPDQITEAREQKRTQNGAFNKRIWLEKVVIGRK